MFFFLVVLLLCIIYASTYSPNVCVVYTPTIRFRRENKTLTRISKTRCAPAQEINSGWQRIQSAGISFIPSIHTAHILQTQLGTSRGRHPYSQNLEEAPRIFVVTPGKKSEFFLRRFAAVHSRGFNFCLRVCRWRHVFVCFLTNDTFVLSSSLGIHGRESQSFGLVES